MPEDDPGSEAQFVIGSPMCTAFSILQGLNKWWMGSNKWNALWEKGVRHMRFAVNIYRMQADEGRCFLHEHPDSASSWKLPEMVELMNQLGIHRSVAHMCRYGMTASDNMGSGRVKKPTGFHQFRLSQRSSLQQVPWWAQTYSVNGWKGEGLSGLPRQVAQSSSEWNSTSITKLWHNWKRDQ